MKILLVSLGCDKNRVDSEHMLGLLSERGHMIVDDENEAEAIIVNSCCFIGDAKEESINTILEMAEYKKSGKLKRLVVTGCLAQRYAEDIKAEIPEVDAIVGTTAFDSIVQAVESEGFCEKLLSIDRLVPGNKRIISGESYVSYLKIAEGCGKHCTYCVIPLVRGNYRSVPMEELLSEARYLAENGTSELILVAQETTLYGTDLYGKKSLHVLLEKLSEIEGLNWIRVMYCYPEEIYDELLDTMAANEKIVNYLDIPVQHASDRILKAMGRKTSRKGILSVLKKIKKKIPDAALRTSLITGFPGETEEDVEILKDFIKEAGFARIGVFTYSREENTPAAVMPGQVPEREKKRRRKEIMQLAAGLSKERLKGMVGKTLSVMIEGFLPDEEVYVGRSYMDAPEIDGCVFLFSDEKHMSGEVVKALITGADKYDLTGEILENESSE
ncbi:MAG: 30S ribosomal protein S12 methylthiotransferase RimO [Lachnospiraceae bacterium]|nr:30S ribosomal protein S12 methylthiotransferase RimO [Lachnospiraceae bacterium]MBR6274265.1 30S ribosomal protein S12 methylthiotransferase RimO [Lachnospiraceae bacterium]